MPDGSQRRILPSKIRYGKNGEPISPCKEDFGISSDSFESFQTLEIRAILFGLIMPFIVAGLFILPKAYESRNPVASIILGCGVTLFVGMFPAFFSAGIAAFLPRKFHPTGKLLDKYDAALKEFFDASREFERRKREFWKNLSNVLLEKEVALLFEQRGFKTLLTPPSGDGGVDVYAWKNETKLIIQCKGYSKALGPSPIRELYGTLMSDSEAKVALMICPNGYTMGAIAFSEGKPLRLWSVEEILKFKEGGLDPFS